MGLVETLAIILIAAGVFTIVSRVLKQPLILGYIVAGFIVSPHLGLFPGLSMDLVHEWSEIGIIFLLFALGLEFSFKKLLKVGSSALITAGTQFIGMFTLGIVVGSAMSWTMMESIFLGGMLSMSSTAIIIKAYDEMSLKRKPWASLVFGVLVVQDLIAVVLLVLLSTMAVSQKFAGGEMLFSILKLVFFIILWFLVGIYVIPSLLRKAHKYMNDEILLLVSIGLCFGMVVGAEAAGFSSALGAFVMGSILSETMEAERIEVQTVPIKNLFSAVFFVSVGMMIDPATVAQHWLPVLVITITVIAGILVFSTAGALMSAKGLDNALHTSFSLAQLGEFSFIIAALGGSLGVMRDFIYPVIIAVSVITTFTTPYMIKAAGPVSKFLYARLPAKITARLDPPPGSRRSGSAAENSEWKLLLRQYFLRVLLYGVILIAIYIGSHYLDSPLEKLLPTAGELLRSVIVVMVTLLVMLPFLYGLIVNTDSMKSSVNRLLNADDKNKWTLMFLVLLRVFISVFFVIIVIVDHFTLAYWALLLIIAGAFTIFIMARRSIGRLPKLETRFMENLTRKEMEERKRKPVTTYLQAKLDGYDVHLEQVVISPNSVYAGRQLSDLPFRHLSGANIVKIERGDSSIVIPAGEEVVFPYDKLIAVGTSEQLEKLKAIMEQDVRPAVKAGPEDFSMDAYTLTEESYLSGKTLRSVAMRSAGCMVISVLRGDDFITNPKPDFSFKAGDIIWLAGERKSCEWFV